MKMWSDRAIKRSLSSSVCALEHARNSTRSDHSFLERWVCQLTDCLGSGTAQQSFVHYGLEMESHRSKSVESIYIPFYSIPPIVGSLIPVLASPDTEIPFQTLPISKFSASPFLHEDMVRSGHKDSVAQRSMSSTTYPNFSRIGIQLHETVGAPTFRLSEKRDGTEIHPAVPIIDGISAFQLHTIYQETLLQYSPNTWVPAPCSDMSRCRNTALIFDHPEFFCCCH